MIFGSRGKRSHRKKSRTNRSTGAWRLYAVGVLLALMLGGVIARLFQLQVIDGRKYAEIARAQYESRAPLQADRGNIYDRNGVLLASNVPAMSYAVDPTHVEQPDSLAERIADFLGGDTQRYRKLIGRDDRSFVWIKRKVTGPAIRRMRSIDDDGLITIEEPLRRFEYGEVAGQLLGCVNLDNAGLSGIELSYDEKLQGKDGYIILQRDARGHRRPDVDLPRVDPQHGESLELTIDITIQSVVESELQRGIEEADATSGTVVALNPSTGEILAMATAPSFDPNHLDRFEQSRVRPRAVTDTYEPGSTIKGIVAAAALDAGTADVTDRFDGEGGLYHLPDGTTIRDDHAVDLVTFAEALTWSSNIVFSKIAQRMDRSTFYRYIRDFGFGIATGVDLPGEVRGDVKRPDEFGPETQAFMAFGYQIAVTPIQLAAAYGAIANGGRLMRPHIVKSRRDQQGRIIEETEPAELRRVVSQETANTIRSLLVDVVDNGTGRAARTDFMSVAGKTGTAQALKGGSYSSDHYNASFVGFFPAENPQAVLLVLLNEPKNGYYGGQVAAPVFLRIAHRIAAGGMIDGVTRPIVRVAANSEAKQPEGSESAFVPDLRGLSIERAERLAERNGLNVRIAGGGKRVVAQSPNPGTHVDRAYDVVLKTPDNDATTIPDVRGLPLRRALALVGASGREPEIFGSGPTIVRQDPLSIRSEETADVQLKLWRGNAYIKNTEVN